MAVVNLGLDIGTIKTVKSIRMTMNRKVIKGVLKMRGSKMSMYKIANHYADEGVLNRNGNPIDRNQIRRIVEYAKRSDT